MEKISKKIGLIIPLAIGLATILLLSSLDWEQSWFEPIALLFFIILTGLAIIDLKKTFLLLIAILPGSVILNEFKVNIANYIPSSQYYNLPINLVGIICFFLVILGVITIFLNYQKIKSVPLKLIISSYIIYVFFSIFWSVDKSASLSGIIYFITPFFVYIITYSYFSKKEDLIKIIAFSIISSVLPVIISIYQIITKDFFFEPDSTLERIKGPFTHPNLFGLYLFLVLALTISFYLAKNNATVKDNKLTIFYGLLLTVMLTLSYSRVSWASLALFLLLTTAARKAFFIFLAAISPIIAIIFSFVDNLRMRILELFNTAIFNSWIARKNIWKVAWGEMLKKPLFGHGAGSSETVIEAAKPWQGGSSIPHNDFMLYALELGIAGVVFFVAYTVGSLYNTYKIFQKEANKNISINVFGKTMEINFKILIFCILAILIATIPASFFESTSRRIINQIIIWAILGSLFNLQKLEQKNV